MRLTRSFLKACQSNAHSQRPLGRHNTLLIPQREVLATVESTTVKQLEASPPNVQDVSCCCTLTYRYNHSSVRFHQYPRGRRPSHKLSACVRSIGGGIDWYRYNRDILLWAAYQASERIHSDALSIVQDRTSNRTSQWQKEIFGIRLHSPGLARCGKFHARGI